MSRQLKIGSKVRVIKNLALSNYPKKNDVVVIRDIIYHSDDRKSPDIYIEDYKTAYFFSNEVELASSKKKLHNYL